jgi:hypothetical protein
MLKWQKEAQASGNHRANNPIEIDKHRALELGKCYSDYVYFINTYCKIYDSVMSDWVPFMLWDAQVEALHAIHANQLTVILKARQLGMTWVSLGYALWQIIFRPIAAVSLFSRREEEAIYMLSEERLRGMFNGLPPWMQRGHEATTERGKEWILANGSSIRAFPTSAGDGYVSTLAVVDEADLTPDLNRLMRAVKPTIDNGGKLILLSRVDKTTPNSEFKSIYRGARTGENGWKPLFLPWYSHPGRNEEWYERQRRDIMSRTQSLDDLYEQYPATDTEALAGRSLDKRIPPIWLERCFEELKPIHDSKSPSLPNLHIYKKPEVGARYVLGADPAEGNPTSDDSSLIVVDMERGEEVCSFSGKYEPAVFASYITEISGYYNQAPAMVERNNHGHAVIQWLEEHSRRVRLLLGHDAETHKPGKRSRQKQKRKKAGWMSSKVGKAILYTTCADHLRKCANVDEDASNPPVKVLHNLLTYIQLTSIEGASLQAPEGDHDDRADAFCLAQCGRAQLISVGSAGSMAMATTKGWGL